MPEPFDLRLYLEHLRSRWAVAATVVGVAVATALALSYAQHRKYTASVSLLIEPPSTSDPRAAMAVSPIYLESLRTYEHFATSDHVFAQAVQKFGMRNESQNHTLESLKKSVLRVSIPRNTKILKIQVTLPDAKRAHALATYLAEQTVELSRRTAQVSDRQLAEAARKDAESIRNRLQAAQSSLEEAMRQAPTPEALQAELDRLRARRTEVERFALSAALTLDDLEDRARSTANADGGPIEDPQYVSSRLRVSRARARRLQEESAALQASIVRNENTLAARKARIETLAAQYRVAQAASAEADSRVRGIEGVTGFRAERISLFDPGFIPERPSSPNVPLNLFVALTLAVMLSTIYLTVEFALRQRPNVHPRPLSKVVGKP